MSQFSLSAEGEKFIVSELKRYETPRSAIIPCLYQVQKEKGYIEPEAVHYLSEKMNLPEAWINEVLHFYTMFNKEKVGKLHVQVCCNVSCSMNGGRELADHICNAFGIQDETGSVNKVSSDGRVSLTRVECLGSCGTGPMMQVNDEYYENLTNESAVKIIKELEV